MIYVALGGNLPTKKFGPPLATLRAAIRALESVGRSVPLKIRARSPWYESVPVPRSDQPLFVNGVIAIETRLPSPQLLELLHCVECEFGRVRLERNEPRPLDLDLIAYHDEISPGADGGPVLPHPRMCERAFVLLPLRDIAPWWRHPESDKSIDALVEDLPSLGEIRRL